eukprot:392410-Pyramimonas_sp.AAC.1
MLSARIPATQGSGMRKLPGTEPLTGRGPTVGGPSSWPSPSSSFSSWSSSFGSAGLRAGSACGPRRLPRVG